VTKLLEICPECGAKLAVVVVVDIVTETCTACSFEEVVCDGTSCGGIG